ncbi:expressed unknown protein [Seminavis robusta]|uniref:Uncharacterized protein n=1 Tax=Seminavis robusta TaxID=568900 RepID=A0A9N8HCT8_9STRA|nr:expressed unknown protein [Seminavis robusta]|eukprot:Sro232_g094010.1 n/a (332) ;mRNA; f:71265-72260
MGSEEHADVPPPVEGEKKKKSKKKKHKRGSVTGQSPAERKAYGKQKDLMPQFSAMPEFTNYKDYANDDDSILSAGSRYETKEDQDVAVFMALAGRMNIDSLLFILNGHAREMNLPSSEYLLPQNKEKAKVLASKKKKEFCWKEDEDGNVALEIFEIEPMKGADMWFDDDFSQKILMGAIRDVRYYQANKPDYINSVETLATQPDSAATEGHMKTLINDKHARGLEVHICSYIEEVRREFINAILDEQDDCEDAGENYDNTADRLRKAGLQFTVQAQEFAYKLAKCDHIVALKASLSKWDKPKTSKKKPGQKIERSSSGSRKKAASEVVSAA